MWGYCLMGVNICFFFKQKTAYEMRSSDWSSDVCASDLWRRKGQRARLGALPRDDKGDFALLRRRRILRGRAAGRLAGSVGGGVRSAGLQDARSKLPRGAAARGGYWTLPEGARSEEHTSELQSLMRISYAVFCLKKKTK